jgi:hypothetical protein
LLLIALASIVSMGVGTGFFLFATGQHNSAPARPTAAALHKTALPATPLSTKAATPVALVESYNGTISDLSLHMTTKLSLAQIQQSRGSFCSLNAAGHCVGAYGVWSAAPTSS